MLTGNFRPDSLAVLMNAIQAKNSTCHAVKYNTMRVTNQFPLGTFCEGSLRRTGFHETVHGNPGRLCSYVSLGIEWVMDVNPNPLHPAINLKTCENCILTIEHKFYIIILGIALEILARLRTAQVFTHTILYKLFAMGYPVFSRDLANLP
jgi:hypothetical protein